MPLATVPRCFSCALTLGFLALVACEREVARSAPSSPHGTAVVPAWVLASETESEQLLTNRCWDLAPPELVEFSNPDFRECFSRAERAVDRAWGRLAVRAWKACVDTGQSCCFDTLPEDYDLFPPTLHFGGLRLPGPVAAFQERMRACNELCTNQIGRAPEENLVCRPSIIKAPHYPGRERTAAMRAVVAECSSNPDAVAKCAWLSGMLTRASCTQECQQAPVQTP